MNSSAAKGMGGSNGAAPHAFSDSEILLSQSLSGQIAKDITDFVFALLLLILTAPMVLLSMLLVKLTSRGPAVYSQTRLGRRGKPFTVYKLRTMYDDCESLTGARWSMPGDSRITPLGRWLRKTHLDELPQLWNVLRGEMSLVGPRPERPEFIPTLEQAIPYYRSRLLVRPGVTGLAQILLPSDTDLDSVRIKIAYDLHYVQNISVLLDVKICWATAGKMAGMPFALLARIFGFSNRTEIEANYQTLVEEYQRRKAWTTATSSGGAEPLTA